MGHKTECEKDTWSAFAPFVLAHKGGWSPSSTRHMAHHASLCTKQGPCRDSRKKPGSACSDRTTAAGTLPLPARFREGVRQRHRGYLSYSAWCFVYGPSGTTLGSRVHWRSRCMSRPVRAAHPHRHSCSRWWHEQRHLACSSPASVPGLGRCGFRRGGC